MNNRVNCKRNSKGTGFPKKDARFPKFKYISDLISDFSIGRLLWETLYLRFYRYAFFLPKSLIHDLPYTYVCRNINIKSFMENINYY